VRVAPASLLVLEMCKDSVFDRPHGPPAAVAFPSLSGVGAGAVPAVTGLDMRRRAEQCPARAGRGASCCVLAARAMHALHVARLARRCARCRRSRRRAGGVHGIGTVSFLVPRSSSVL